MNDDVRAALGLEVDQSLELLKALHILTRDGRLNQDSRRKLKQVNHLYQFIAPLLDECVAEQGRVTLVDHGAGKSYLGFILYDRFFQSQPGMIYGIESRAELVDKSRALAARLGFDRMRFLASRIEDTLATPEIPPRVDVVTALHACDTATDDAIRFALAKAARFIVLAPCCQAEVAAELRRVKQESLARSVLAELWRHPLHSRELGALVTNVLRCLLLEAHGYAVTVTELVGWEHSLKNELILARRHEGKPRGNARARAETILRELHLEALSARFFYE